MKYAAAAGVIITALAGATAAQAGGCAPGSSCYRKVTTPAVYGTYQQSVLVRPAQTSFAKIPAQYATTTEQVMVRPAQQIPIHHPAVTQTVSERVLVQAATKVWSVTRDAHGNEVGCWVEKPAVYATQQRTVIVQPATTSYQTTPAEYRTFQRQVVVSPERLVAQTTPAVYTTQTYQAQVAPATTSWQPIGHQRHRQHHAHAQGGHRHHAQHHAGGHRQHMRQATNRQHMQHRATQGGQRHASAQRQQRHH